MNPTLYCPLFLHLAVLLSLLQALRPAYDQLPSYSARKEWQMVLFWTLLLSLWLGLRPIDGVFVDTTAYAAYFHDAVYSSSVQNKVDWLFFFIMFCFAKAGLGVHAWLLFIEAIYIGGTAYSVCKLFPRRTMTAFAAVLVSFSFYTYGVNGIRNGMACSLFLVGMTLVIERKWTWAVLFLLWAFNMHTSVALDIGALIIALVYKNTKAYLLGWLFCIVLALVAGGYFETLFISQGIIDTGRDMSYYMNENRDMSVFSNTGFRYDFMLYGCVPILVGCYFVLKKHFSAPLYKTLLHTYIVCNSFWVLVNRNWLSNRIAYLSWVMYAFVLMYPLLMAPYVKRRKLWISCALVGSASFSYLMWLLGKYH